MDPLRLSLISSVVLGRILFLRPVSARAVTEFAPLGQDQVLRSSSVMQKIKYSARSVEYKTFDVAATEVLRLSFKPLHVTAGGAALNQRDGTREAGYTLQSLSAGDWIVRVRHVNSGEINLGG